MNVFNQFFTVKMHRNRNEGPKMTKTQKYLLNKTNTMI